MISSRRRRRRSIDFASSTPFFFSAVFSEARGLRRCGDPTGAPSPSRFAGLPTDFLLPIFWCLNMTPLIPPHWPLPCTHYNNAAGAGGMEMKIFKVFRRTPQQPTHSPPQDAIVWCLCFLFYGRGCGADLKSETINHAHGEVSAITGISSPGHRGSRPVASSR